MIYYQEENILRVKVIAIDLVQETVYDMGLSANWVCGYPIHGPLPCWFGFGAQVVFQVFRNHRLLFPWNFGNIYFFSLLSLTSLYPHLLVSIVNQCILSSLALM